MSSTRAADRASIIAIEIEIPSQEGPMSIRTRELRCEMRSAQARLDSYRYPVLTLPNELTSKIFVHFLPVYPLCPPITGIQSPTLLTQICHKWTVIALATPELWRALSLHYISHQAAERQIETLESWLTRSRSCPLSIETSDYCYHLNLPIHRFMATVIPHCKRWEYAKVAADPSHIVDMEGPMPLLRQLEIETPWVYLRPPKFMAPSFRDVPQLRSVTLWGSTCRPTLLPWAQLTSLTLLCRSPQKCALILAQTVSLVYCKLALVSDGAWDAILPTKLECLESLVLIQFMEYGEPPIGYLDTFVVPSLQSLQVPDEYITPDPLRTLASLISKSGCELQELCVTGKLSMSKNMYRDAFPSVPSISFDATITEYVRGYKGR
ncbi:hypothetical protein DFH09DRAFT_1339403 [Mycena vulgaris]|nr:hypothetical protein DFH09DRAFT_1339403 [Mycena vulgaris]